MRRGPAPLKRVERGETAADLHLVLADGEVVILHGHGLHDDERCRTTDRAPQVLKAALESTR
jgi:hypothetical protein